MESRLVNKHIKIHNLFVLLFGSEFSKSYIRDQKELYAKDSPIGAKDSPHIKNDKDLLLEK
jgi:hypothetical protein